MATATKNCAGEAHQPPRVEGNHTSWRAFLRVSRVGGPVLAERNLSGAFMSEFASGLWMDECLRKGRPEIPLDGLICQLRPSFLAGHEPRCLKITIEVTFPEGTVITRVLAWGAFAGQAIQIASSLRKQGLLEAEEDFAFEIIVLPDLPTAPGEMLQSTVNRAPLPIRRSGLLPSLIAQARTIGEPDPAFFPILITREAHDKAETLARAGASAEPPVETGAILVSELWSCVKTGEFFLVIRDAIELRGAESGPFQLQFTGSAWAWIESVRKTLASRPETAGYRVVGQAHGHNFLPAAGAQPCDECHSLPACRRHTAFASIADTEWTRAVFLPYQPWGCCLIFGLNARGEPIENMFSLRDGELVPRGFQVIAEKVLTELELTEEP